MSETWLIGEDEVERKAVRSGNIASVGYDARTKTLEIEFKSGGIAGIPSLSTELGAERS